MTTWKFDKHVTYGRKNPPTSQPGKSCSWSCFWLEFQLLMRLWESFFSRPEGSQGLLYKQCCHWFAHWVILLKRMRKIFLTYLYGPAKPKRYKIQQPVIKKDNLTHKLICTKHCENCKTLSWEHFICWQGVKCF